MNPSLAVPSSSHVLPVDVGHGDVGGSRRVVSSWLRMRMRRAEPEGSVHVGLDAGDDEGGLCRRLVRGGTCTCMVRGGSAMRL